MDRWIKRKERDWAYSVPVKAKIGPVEWKLQGGRFQLDWTALDEGDEPLVTGGMRKKSRQTFI